MTSTTTVEIWFLTGSQGLYGEETLRPGRRAVRGRSPGRSTTPPADPGPGRVEAGAHRRRRDPAGRAWRPTPTTTCVGVIAWMHTFSPAKMWIAGLDALRKPLLHLHTQANVDAAVVAPSTWTS